MAGLLPLPGERLISPVGRVCSLSLLPGVNYRCAHEHENNLLAFVLGNDPAASRESENLPKTQLGEMFG